MKKSILITAILLSVTTISVQADESIQHKLARVVLDAENASYVVMEQTDRVSVVTYGYKNAGETCKLLQDKGVNVISVENYITSNDNTLTITSKSC